ncbi:MAG: hypothetical protein A2521_10595 [Deltaproteobacteria bacterium RIFOXYD12_FULL_57_12]|nr:MAG: hypothetical protein A2521_10595 [Deltaproteobacteria bacterium RIFOXYD12_FULL_57_12]
MNLSAKKKMRGFTLVELMVAILLSSLAAVAFYRGYMAATIGYDVQAQVTELNQNVRFGLEKMARELRMAGYNPARVSGSGFVTANSNTVRFTKDMNGNGVISGDTEDIALAVGGNELTRNGSAVVGNVDALDFVYLDANGAVTATLGNIRFVQISLVMRVSREDYAYTNSEVYRNMQGATVYTAPGDNFRRLLLSAQVSCRNRGL